MGLGTFVLILQRLAHAWYSDAGQIGVKLFALDPETVSMLMSLQDGDAEAGRLSDFLSHTPGKQRSREGLGLGLLNAPALP